jgi:hypothetical protein
MSGWADIAAPVVLPYPTSTLTTPGGNPARTMRVHMKSAVSGVNSDGLRTTVLPVARAGAIFHDIMRTEDGQKFRYQYIGCPACEEEYVRGKFHGMI